MPRFMRSMALQNLLFCAHTLCMSYVSNTCLLVRSSVQSKQLLCFVHGKGQKSEQKPTTKIFVGFQNQAENCCSISAQKIVGAKKYFVKFLTPTWT